MRFVIAPDWVMKLPDDAVLTSKQVLGLYGYCGINAWIQIRDGHIPIPDKSVQQGPNRKLLYWSVKHIKNNLKLPTEIIK